MRPRRPASSALIDGRAVVRGVSHYRHGVLMDIDQLCMGIARMVNLIAFDACDVASLTYSRDADPLKVTATWRAVAPIAETLHTPLRRAIRAQVVQGGALPGKIELGARLSVTIYLKSLRSPAYRDGDSPQGGL